MSGETKERMITKQTKNLSGLLTGMLLVALPAANATLAAQMQSQQPRYPVPASSFQPTSGLQPPVTPTTAAITPNGKVVEDVVARVNDQVITRSEYERSQMQLLQESKQQNLTQDEYNEREQNLLRDMIDQQILLSKGKELGITGDAETIRQLDEIRKQNHLDSMEALEKAASQQGVSFEDFKQNIRNNVITQQVVRDEVGRRINMTHADEEAYYNAHSKEFEMPEQVHLSEILVPTPENATDAQVGAAQAKADGLETQLKSGKNFAELAKSSSGGPTASAGGDLGDFKRGTLGDVLEKATFPLPAGTNTEPIRTRQGFVILRVDSHQAAGVPPLKDVDQQVQQALYMDSLQPALRKYLTTARDEAYIDVKPGFIDSGTNRNTGKPLFTTYTPPPLKKKVVKHQANEDKKAQAAQASLAAARAKVAAKNEAKAAAQAAKNGATPVSKSTKKPKIRREKIRYGQAPRNALPPALNQTADTTETPAPPLAGQAPGAAMASNADAVTTISTGTGVDQDNPLAPQSGPARKTRYADRQHEHEEKQAEQKLAKAEVKASARPIKATSDETADEKQQATPLGLNGDTVKKQKHKRQKGEAKERLQDKAAPAEPAPVAPTVNPTLGGSAVSTTPASSDTPAKSSSDKLSSDQTTLPPATAPAPGAMPQGQPIPATTSTQPNAPTTTIPPPQ